MGLMVCPWSYSVTPSEWPISLIPSSADFDGVQTVGRKTGMAKDVWANYFWGDRRLGDNSHFKKTFRRKTVGRQKLASQCSTSVRNSVVRATIKVNGKPPILGSLSPLTSWSIDLKFHTGWLCRQYETTCQNDKKGWNAKVNLGYFLIFLNRISCPPVETTF